MNRCGCVCVVGGRVWWDLRGGHAKNMASKGVTGNKMLGGGVTKEILSSFAVTPSMIMQTTYQNTKYQHF